MQSYVTSFLGAFTNMRKKGAFPTNPRPFSVVSLRIRGNAVFYEENNTTYVSEGDVLFVPENTAYWQECDTDDEVIAIHLTLDKPLSSNIFKISPENFQSVLPLFKKLEKMYGENKEANHFVCLSLLYEILSLFDEKNTADLPPTLLKAVSVIDKNYMNPDFSVFSLSEKLGVSQAYLRLLFNKHLSTSPNAYIRSLRFKRAKELLSSNYYSVSEASIMSGFANEKNFSTAFRKEFGKTPSEFKKSAL